MTGVLVVAAISVLTTAAAVALARAGRGGTATSAVAPGLAAGVMLWLAVVEVAPDATVEIGALPTAATMSAGAALVWVSARLAHRTRVAAGVAPVIGVALVLHDLPEGFAVGAIVGAGGLAVALPVVVAIAAHNLPEKLAFVAPATEEGTPLRPMLLAATLPEPLGAALAGVGGAVAPGAVAVAVALAGGMMAAVALGTLPVVAARARELRPFAAGGATGLAAMALMAMALPG